MDDAEKKRRRNGMMQRIRIDMGRRKEEENDGGENAWEDEEE